MMSHDRQFVSRECNMQYILCVNQQCIIEFESWINVELLKSLLTNWEEVVSNVGVLTHHSHPVIYLKSMNKIRYVIDI